MTNIVLVLDNIRSIFNTASLFRTANGAGVSSVYLCGVTPSPHDRFGRIRSDFAKVSLGAERSVSWTSCVSTARCISRLRRDHFFIIALEQHPSSVSYANVGSIVGAHANIALILGNEVRGVSPDVFRLCDIGFELPMHGDKESLNVSVAGGIALYKLRFG
ncbi:MAG: hypothetical protein RIQ54_371 [Candidatus Parcubacteria bacterium]|jgi:tRNA G18 (ribose-2'-O)-methylase SpoU